MGKEGSVPYEKFSMAFKVLEEKGHEEALMNVWNIQNSEKSVSVLNRNDQESILAPKRCCYIRMKWCEYKAVSNSYVLFKWLSSNFWNA